MKLLSQPIYRLDEIEIDPMRGCLRRDGEEQHLRQQTFQVLIYLLEQRERLVTKEELIARIWPETAITDDALVQCIVEIRKALGDDSRHPRLVKTIPKAGYRFIGRVDELWLETPTALSVTASAQPMAVEMEEVTTVEIEVQEEMEEGTGRRGEGRRLLPPISPSPRLRVAFFSVGVLILAGLAVYLGLKAWPSQRPVAEVTLPQVPGKKAVAVMYFENQSGSRELDWLREGLADMFITDLSRSKKLTILSRQQLYTLLERTGRAGTEPMRLEDALEIARRSQAEVLVLGSFAKLGEQVRIDVSLHDARTGRMQVAEHLIVDHVGQLLTQVDLLSLKLASHLGAAPAEPDAQRGLAEVMTDNLEAYRYYSLALEKALGLHSVEAIALLEKAIALDPQFAMAHARIGYVYAVTWSREEKGKPYLERAFQLSHRLTEKDKLHITAWYAIANLDFTAAAQTFREIIARYPLEVEAYHRLGKLLAGEERFEEAISIYKQGLLIDADSPMLYNNLGNLYQMLSRHDEAIAMHERGVQLTPNNPNAHDSLGASYQWAGRYEQAIAEYQRALQLNPEFEVAIVHLGNTYFQLGRYAAALAQYQRYIQVGPSDGERSRGYGCLAWVHWKKGELDQAEAAVRIGMKINKQYAGYAFLLALERGDLQTAEKLKAQVFAYLSAASGRGARLSLRYPAYLRGYLALKSGRAEEAIEDFKEALRHGPVIWNLDPFEDCLAKAYLELGRWDEAIAEYERILRLNPNYPLAQYHLGQADERKGQGEQARAAYTRFLQIWKDADPDIPEVVEAKARLADRPHK